VASISIDAADTLLTLLRSTEGVTAAIAEIQLRENRTVPELAGSQMIAAHMDKEVAEQGRGLQYPVLFVYCDRVMNSQREKFRKFSGRARLNIEIKVSNSREEGLGRGLETYVDAVTEVLHRSHGDWGGGVSYSGAYEVHFEAAKKGGRNFLQTAKVVLEVDVSRD
jgi:hypothetical protein